MNAAQAYERVVATGPFDDPDSVSFPVRWYFAPDGILERCGWRDAIPHRFPEFVAPGPVRFGASVPAVPPKEEA